MVLIKNEYEIYNRSKVPNPAVDYGVSKYLAIGSGEQPPLHVQFDLFRKRRLPKNNVLYKGQTYDELTDPAIKEQAMRDYFLTPTINKAIEIHTAAFERMISKKSGVKKAAGFYRNLYALENAALKKSSGKTFDDVIKLYSNSPRYEFDKKYDNARDFIGDSSGIEEELVRRRMLIEFSDEYFNTGKGKALRFKAKGNKPYVND